MGQQRRCVGNPGPDAVQQLMSGCIISPLEGLFEGHRVSRPMALEDQPPQAQQCRTVVPTVINSVFESR
jgi:hypothetical protein